MNFWLKRGENDQWELLPAEGTELIAGHYAVITRSPQPHFTLTIDMIRYALDDPSPEASPSEPSGLSLLWSTRLGTKGRGKDWVELERQQRFIRTNDEGIGVILAPSHLSAGYWEFRCHDADLIAELFGEAQANVLHLKVVPDPTKTPAAEVSTPSATSSDLKGIPTEPSHALVDPEISSSHPLTTLHHEVPIQADVAPGSGGLTESIAPSESMGTAGSTRLRDSIGIPPSVEINQLGEPSGMSGSLEPSEPSESFDRSSRSLESPEGMGSSRSHESSDAFGSTRLTGSPPPTHASDPKRFRGITDPTTGSDPSPSYPATHVPDPFAVSGSHLTSGAEPKSEERSGSRVSSKLPMDPSLPALSSSDPSTAWQPDFSLMHHDIQGTPGEVLTLTGRIGCSGELEAELYAEDQLIFQQQRLIHLMPDAQSAVFSISLPLPPTPWSGPLTGVLTLNQTGLSDPPPRIDFSIRCRDPQTPPPILSYRSKGPESWNRWRSPQAPPPSFESPAIPLAPPEPSIPSTEVGIVASPSADSPSSPLATPQPPMPTEGSIVPIVASPSADSPSSLLATPQSSMPTEGSIGASASVDPSISSPHPSHSDPVPSPPTSDVNSDSTSRSEQPLRSFTAVVIQGTSPQRSKPYPSPPHASAAIEPQDAQDPKLAPATPETGNSDPTESTDDSRPWDPAAATPDRSRPWDPSETEGQTLEPWDPAAATDYTLEQQDPGELMDPDSEHYPDEASEQWDLSQDTSDDYHLTGRTLKKLLSFCQLWPSGSEQPGSDTPTLSPELPQWTHRPSPPRFSDQYFDTPNDPRREEQPIVSEPPLQEPLQVPEVISPPLQSFDQPSPDPSSFPDPDRLSTDSPDTRDRPDSVPSPDRLSTAPPDTRDRPTSSVPSPDLLSTDSPDTRDRPSSVPSLDRLSTDSLDTRDRPGSADPRIPTAESPEPNGPSFLPPNLKIQKTETPETPKVEIAQSDSPPVAISGATPSKPEHVQPAIPKPSPSTAEIGTIAPPKLFIPNVIRSGESLDIIVISPNMSSLSPPLGLSDPHPDHLTTNPDLSPYADRPFWIKFWVKHAHARSLVDGPRWLLDFARTEQGEWQATTRMTIPLGIQELLFEASAYSHDLNYQSERVSIRKPVSSSLG